MSFLKVFTGGGVVAGLITGIQSINHPDGTSGMDKIMIAALSALLLARRVVIGTQSRALDKIHTTYLTSKGYKERERFLDRLEEVLTAANFDYPKLEYLLAMPSYLGAMPLIYQAVSSQKSDVDLSFNSSFNPPLNSTSGLTNTSNYTSQKSTNVSRVKPSKENVYADANNSEMATLTGMDLPMAAAATALAAAGIFAVYKYREHQKELREAQAQKALDEALARKNESENALLEGEARRR